MRDHVLLHVNGAPVSVRGEAVFNTVSRFLRDDGRGLVGTKIVCEEGDCGACTVLVGRPENGRLRYRPINSCIQFVFQLDGAHIVTVEGVGGGMDRLSRVQEEMIRCHGAQCGYCTPGFITALTGMLEDVERPTAKDVCAALTGNLCRCTGYEPIIKAGLESFDTPRLETLYPSGPIIEAIAAVEREPVTIGTFFKPVDLESAIRFKADHPKCVIVQGATDFGVWRNKRGYVPDAVMVLDGIQALGEISMERRPPSAADSRSSTAEATVAPSAILHVGGRVTLAQFESAVRELVPSMAGIMDRFGSPQIKNAGTLAGNIANASPIADTLPFLYVTGAMLDLTGLSGTRTLPIKDFYLGYKKLDLRPDEIITRISIPLPSDAETLRLYKVSKRSHLDISSFTAAMLMRRTDGRIDSMRIAYGGVAPVVLRLSKTEEFLAGKPLSLDTFAAAGEIARGEIAPISDVRGSREFRLQLAENVLHRFYYEACLAMPQAGARS
jgi:xanthine dehydrogenase small subunit